MEFDRFCEWICNNPEAEATILRIALTRQMQQEYTSIDKLCDEALIKLYQKENIIKWYAGMKEQTADPPFYEIGQLVNYIMVEETERYNRAVFIYYQLYLSFFTD